MKSKIHGMAGMLALLCISSFWLSTALVELFGSSSAIASVKQFIIWGMLILIPSLITTGASGFYLAKNNNSKLITNKKKRMPIIALNGLLILLPSAIFLNYLSSKGEYDLIFYVVQSIELIAGAGNIFLIGSSLRDGFRLKTA